MPAKQTKKRRITVLAIVSTLILATLISLLTLIFGRVAGVEFSPTHFTSRNFNFYEIPLIQLQVWPISRSSEPVSITNLLRSQNYIEVPKGESQTWHLVEIRRGPNAPTPADAEILISHLKLGENTSSSVWEQWSRSHPAAAAVLWPEVKKLAERELYLLIPELFSIAEQETDPQQLESKINQNLRDQYRQLAKDLIAAKQPQMAASVLDEALQDFPEDSALLGLEKQLNDR